jgi:hypothetical protein
METVPRLRLPAGYRYKVRHHFHIPKEKKISLSKENIQESEKITLYFLFVFNPQTARILPT